MHISTPCPSDVPVQWSPAETKLAKIRTLLRSSMPPTTILMLVYEIVEHGPGIIDKVVR
jgi:hypothetical protein